MSTPDPTALVTAPLGWAKARPFVFVFFVLVVFLVAIRFRTGIASALSKIPVIGKFLTGIAAAGAFVLFANLGQTHARVVEHPPVALAESCHLAGYFHGQRVQFASLDGEVFTLVMPGMRSGSGGAS